MVTEKHCCAKEAVCVCMFPDRRTFQHQGCSSGLVVLGDSTAQLQHVAFQEDMNQSKNEKHNQVITLKLTVEGV